MDNVSFNGGLFLLYTHKIWKNRGDTRGQNLLLFYVKGKNTSKHVSLTSTDFKREGFKTYARMEDLKGGRRLFAGLMGRGVKFSWDFEGDLTKGGSKFCTDCNMKPATICYVVRDEPKTYMGGELSLFH